MTTDSASASDGGTMTALQIFMIYVCPSLGCIISFIMCAAPVQDLSKALTTSKSLGFLNPYPWAVLTASCFGWICYGYCIHDPFVLASNVPGFFISLWLNIGAIKLQYLELASLTSLSSPSLSSSSSKKKQQPKQQEQTKVSFSTPTTIATADTITPRRRHYPKRTMEIGEDGSARIGILSNQHMIQLVGDDCDAKINVGSGGAFDEQQQRASVEQQHYYEDHLKIVPQERSLLRLLFIWFLVLLWVGWFPSIDYLPQHHPALVIGIFVNLNSILFYASPLLSTCTIIQTQSAEGIHLPTMLLGTLHTTFWMTYGVALHNYIIIVPNAIGFVLGILQALLCFIFPQRHSNSNINIHDDIYVIDPVVTTVAPPLKTRQQQLRQQQKEVPTNGKTLPEIS